MPENFLSTWLIYYSIVPENSSVSASLFVSAEWKRARCDLLNFDLRVIWNRVNAATQRSQTNALIFMFVVLHTKDDFEDSLTMGWEDYKS